MFCADFHKLRVAAALHGEQTPAFESTIDGYTVGVIDASLAMMSAVTVAESLGLGCCCIGYTRTADPRKLSDMLGLPEGVSIVCGLAIGYQTRAGDQTTNDWSGHIADYHRQSMEHGIAGYLREQMGLETK